MSEAVEPEFSCPHCGSLHIMAAFSGVVYYEQDLDGRKEQSCVEYETLCDLFCLDCEKEWDGDEEEWKYS